MYDFTKMTEFNDCKHFQHICLITANKPATNAKLSRNKNQHSTRFGTVNALKHPNECNLKHVYVTETYLDQ